MDISGFEAVVFEEIRMWKSSGQPAGIIAANALRFQNHLYGCLSVLEMFAEGEGDISGERVLIAKDLSDNQIRFDLITDFGKAGCEFGFLTDARGVFDGWSDKYRDVWHWAWREIGWKRDLESVDELEKRLFAFVSGVELEFFQAAMATGELEAEMEKRALRLYEVRRGGRHEGQTRRRRGVTPIQRRRRFKKTRRHVTFDVDDVEDVDETT